MTIKSMRVSTKDETKDFEINTGFKQDDAQSATLFTLVLEHASKKVNNETLRTGQIIPNADDIVLITKRREIFN